jgi:hypothetical protein
VTGVVANRRPSADNTMAVIASLSDTTTTRTHTPCRATAAARDESGAIYGPSDANATITGPDHNAMAARVSHSAAVEDRASTHATVAAFVAESSAAVFDQLPAHTNRLPAAHDLSDTTSHRPARRTPTPGAPPIASNHMQQEA